jgi:hypothetical protein
MGIDFDSQETFDKAFRAIERMIGELERSWRATDSQGR